MKIAVIAGGTDGGEVELLSLECEDLLRGLVELRDRLAASMAPSQPPAVVPSIWSSDPGHG